MDETPLPNGPKPTSPLNKQMSPLAGGVLGGIAVFAYILYKHHDIVRAFLVGAAGFAAAFSVMFIGMYLERRNKQKS